MKTLRKALGVGIAAFVLSASWSHSARAEPLLTIFTFAKSAYDDSKSHEIIVTINRSDQDPAAEKEEFTVNCQVTGGDAVAPADYSASFNGSTWGFGKVRFPPGVRKQSFAIYTHNTTGPDKTLQLALSDPEGPAPVVTGDNPTTS